ncbi:MAG: TRAM domain-containing protein [Candidatus Micrarchaeia archaeon]
MEATAKMEELELGKVAGEATMAEEEILPRGSIEEGEVYSLAVKAKDARGIGIGKVGNFVIFIKNAKTRIGNIYKVKVTKVHRTFAYAELVDSEKSFIGNGSILEP